MAVALEHDEELVAIVMAVVFVAAPGLSTVQPTTWSAPADFLSIRNCTCMSTQPSSRLRPSTFGTSRMLVRYITAPCWPSFITAAVPFTALRQARAPNFSALRHVILTCPPKSAIDLMRDHEIVAVDAEPAAGIHHFVGGGGERHRAAERAAEIERQQHVLLLQA